MATLGILPFMFRWNNYLWPLVVIVIIIIIITSNERRTLPTCSPGIVVCNTRVMT